MAASPGGIEQIGSTLVSAMMMFLGSSSKVYILDKVEGNPTQINGHSAYAVEWDLDTNTATPMEIITNPFCSSGHHFPNGSWVTFGGNGAIGPGGNIGSTIGPTGTGYYDTTYQDYDGENAVRILNPCQSGQSLDTCQWYDNSTKLMKRRWYSTVEALGNGTMVILGGFVNGGYINRNYPNNDPATEGGAAEPTFETYPPTPNFTPQDVNFVIKTSGLNSYPHMFLMPSGKIFTQANYSTMLWDADTNTEYPLPDMPGQVARVYPASGGVAMLPLTPANNYTPTVLFCGGQFLDDYDWGNYSWPFVDTWKVPASNDCQRITPEPTDGSTAAYVQDDNMLIGRTMGQFILLPDGTMLMVNGGANGTAGYATQTLTTPLYGDMPFGMSLAAEPVLTPAIYNPNAPKGSRWSNAGLSASTIPRLYHSSAILLPDASVMIAGSNPNVDYNASTIYATEYRAEKFYPWYWGSTKPTPSGVPSTLTYGGSSFDITFDKSSYSGDANTAAANSTVVVIRTGFTTHAMNMGQRFLQLNNTYTVSSNGSITLHCSQMPQNANLFTPGPAFLYVVVNGIPSNGTYVTVGNGQLGTQPVSDVATLPTSVNTTSNVGGNGSSGSGSPSSTSGSSLSTGVKIGIAAGGAAVLIFLGGLLMLCSRRNKNRAAAERTAAGGANMAYREPGSRNPDAFIPLQQYNNSAWDIPSASNDSRVDLVAPGGQYHDDPRASQDTRYTTGNAPQQRVQYDDHYYDAPPPQQHPRFGGRDDGY
ncbi:DUF1929-domain-containing protein [Clavulina sp. PMI_390]|nr:DUF1929-domain-containing protein [Clavulina sp. PMI_390]